MIKRIILLLVVLSFSTSCVVVKEYDKINLNDPDMVLAAKKADRNITTVHSYREAAAGANGGKTGGGCGCN
ncbi:arginine decarboxylase [Flavobacteriales bacterium 33_180_T64]|nr:arginine decarboxylase [Flavobacteriales bacterium 33_180_T64]